MEPDSGSSFDVESLVTKATRSPNMAKEPTLTGNCFKNHYTLFKLQVMLIRSDPMDVKLLQSDLLPNYFLFSRYAAFLYR